MHGHMNIKEVFLVFFTQVHKMNARYGGYVCTVHQYVASKKPYFTNCQTPLTCS